LAVATVLTEAAQLDDVADAALARIAVEAHAVHRCLAHMDAAPVRMADIRRLHAVAAGMRLAEILVPRCGAVGEVDDRLLARIGPDLDGMVLGTRGGPEPARGRINVIRPAAHQHGSVGLE